MSVGSDVNSLYQAFKTTSVGDFLYAINDEELNLPQLYLKDFIAAVIQPTSEHEAKVGGIVQHDILWTEAYFTTFLMSSRFWKYTFRWNLRDC